MARISSNVLQGLSSPSFGRGMFSVGEAIGGIPGQMKAKKKQDKFNEIMKRGQAAMASAEPDPVVLSGIAQELSALGYTKEAQQFADASRNRGLQAAQRARVGGLLTQASTSKGITPEYAQDFVAAGGTLEQLAQGREAAKTLDEPLREQGRGRLRQMARSKLFDDQDPSQMQGYRNVAKRFKITENEAAQILTQERGTMIERAKTKATVTGKPSYTTVGKIRDSRGLPYNLTEVRTGPGVDDITINYEPIGHETDWTATLEDGKVNKPTFLGGAYTESGTDKSGRAIEEAEAKADINVLEAKGIREVQNFEDVRDKSMQRFPAVREGLNDVNTLLEIVEELEQGGSLTAMQDRVEKVLGVQTEDAGVFNNLAKELLVNRIKAFGANPTEGERNYLEQLIPSLENTQEINTAILTRMKERLERERASIFYITQPNTTRDSYINFVDGLYVTDGAGTSTDTGNKVVDFGDI
jgi:hypothetical protein